MRFLFLIFLFFTGCASQQLAFRSGDTPKKQFRMDVADCEMKGEQNRSTDGMGGLAGILAYDESFERVYDACMRSKGYEKR